LTEQPPIAADPSILRMSDVVKDYRGLRPLRVQRLSLVSGDQIAVVGMDAPAAEMLTTLVTGAALPDQGSVHVLGMSTTGIGNADQWLQLVDRIGLVTDRAALLELFTVVQNLAMSFTLSIEPPPDAVRARVTALAADAGLPEALWDTRVADLDPVDKTRVRLGRALALEPTLLLLEHPTAQVARSDVRPLARDIKATTARRRLTTLVLTGDEDFVEAMALRVMRWDAATGTLRERARRWWPFRPL
jgi:ABC-type transporter Mla maintaining outer membrane lipid asymmetry ATPase subunit MlaF